MHRSKGLAFTLVTMSDEVDIPEHLPNSTDQYVEEQQTNVGSDQGLSKYITSGQEDRITISAGGTDVSADQFFVATSHGLFPAEQLTDGSHTLKNCIIIQDQSGLDTLAGLNFKAVGVGSNPLIASGHIPNKTYRYQWDESVHDPVIPVRCKNTNGELHKNKFGSGKPPFTLYQLINPGSGSLYSIVYPVIWSLISSRVSDQDSACSIEFE